VPLYSFEDLVIRSFKDDPVLQIEMLKSGIKKYETENDLRFLLLNLSRITTANGYERFEASGLESGSILNVLEGKAPPDIELINTMLETLGMEERIHSVGEGI
jgi:hypothetical protein